MALRTLPFTDINPQQDRMAKLSRRRASSVQRRRLNGGKMRTLYGCRLCVAAVACAVIATGCGLTSSPADGLTFTAPTGWRASPGIMGFMQFWRAPSNGDEVIMLFRSPKKLDPDQIITSAKLKDTRIQRQQPIKICHNQPAMYFYGQGTSSSENQTQKEADMRMVMTDVNGTTYFAMYIYPVAMPPNGEAVAAIRELCAKASAT